MTVGGLFEGIGGFPLAAQWAGLTPIWSNEIDPFCCKVLRKNFKHRIIEDDIRNIGAHNLETVDILTGGFPCQPYSSSGKRKGTKDNRHLWPEMLRIIGEIRPSYIVGENVYGITTWNKGLVFEQVQIDLENKGYEVQSFILPACSVNAPHERARVWFIAHTNMQLSAISKEQRPEGTASNHNFGRLGERRIITNSIDRGLSKRNAKQAQNETHETIERFYSVPCWENFPTQSPVCGRNDGVSNRVDRIKGLGNSIVPQLAFEIFEAIKAVALIYFT